MSTTKPSSYDSWKVLILYLDANVRFELFRQVPSLRILEKLVPLRIDSLCFDHMETRVNDTKYTLGICREYSSEQETPKCHKRSNEKGGCEYDLSKHGFNLYFYNETVTPGDVDLKTTMDERDLGQQDGEQATWERQLEIHEYVLTQKTEQMKSEDDEDQVYYGTKENPRLRFSDLEIKQLERLSRLPVEKLKEEIKNYQAYLIPYYCRRDNTLPPYTPKLQLTVESPRGKQTFFHVIDESSYPLNSMVLSSGQATDYEHSIVRSAKKLIIRPNFSGLRTYLPIFMKLHNQSTIVDIKQLPFSVEDQILLIEHWIEVDKELGTYLAYGVSEERTVKELFTQVEQHALGNRVSEKSVEIPMNIDEAMRISYTRNEVKENLGGRENFTKPEWWVKMDVVAAKDK
ncbi:hypothetical protein CAEBREN_18578 [Caenorhabditis brenneri]|uniref:Uncharacterized protein n=1 Tax=Caenorhabditis brenneri TaxID=135651 RepID=G0MDC5_CAEBE|nr:hypothetical protein CAEBREN_18578 [Caenorhabditis brenneri]